MSEERKPEESLMSDETLFFGYAKAIAGGDHSRDASSGITWIIGRALEMVAEHRKLFPKKVSRERYFSLVEKLDKIRGSNLNPRSELGMIDIAVKDWKKTYP